MADAPSVTDWMQGWGSILGLLMSTIAVVFTGWLLRHEINVHREEKADADAAQARLIVGRVIGLKLSGVDDFSGEPVGPAVGLHWEIKNYSTAPVFDVRAEIYPAGEYERKYFPESCHEIEPIAIIADVERGMMEMSPVDFSSRHEIELNFYEVHLVITDAQGLYWKREGNKPPKRVIIGDE